MKEIKVIELFAGVGGFRLGLERASNRFRVIWSNQWEPATKVQHASNIYVKNFGPEGHHNQDISKIPVSEIPDHDLLVGGFPCQDYSVARTLNHAKGLAGKKGVLWWEIYRILEAKQPSYLLLENVDRLLKSPKSQRGRDFAVMLASLSDLGYAVEWRVVNAADYGMPQRRRRIFIFAYHRRTPQFAQIAGLKSLTSWLDKDGLFAQTFQIEPIRHMERFKIQGELDEISETFNMDRVITQLTLFDSFVRYKSVDRKSPFEKVGVMFDRTVATADAQPHFEGEQTNLGDIILKNGSVPSEYFVPTESLKRWAYLKGSKNEKRTNKSSGFEYEYAEGPLVFPDPLDKPSRTIITGEGGPSPSRFKHVIQDAKGHLRRLTPIELERLNMFPDNHTAGVSDIKRAFFMGNALVVGVVERLGQSLEKQTHAV